VAYILVINKQRWVKRKTLNLTFKMFRPVLHIASPTKLPTALHTASARGTGKFRQVLLQHILVDSAIMTHQRTIYVLKNNIFTARWRIHNYHSPAG